MYVSMYTKMYTSMSSRVDTVDREEYFKYYLL
jgi:hypothetical protein